MENEETKTKEVNAVDLFRLDGRSGCSMIRRDEWEMKDRVFQRRSCVSIQIVVKIERVD